MYPKCRSEENCVTATINFVHSKRKGIFIKIKNMLNDTISLRNHISFLTFRLYWTEQLVQSFSRLFLFDILQFCKGPVKVPGKVKRKKNTMQRRWKPTAEKYLQPRRSKDKRKVRLIGILGIHRAKYKKLSNMKLLESTRFEAVNSALSIKTGDSKIIGR